MSKSGIGGLNRSAIEVCDPLSSTLGINESIDSTGDEIKDLFKALDEGSATKEKPALDYVERQLENPEIVDLPSLEERINDLESKLTKAH